MQAPTVSLGMVLVTQSMPEVGTTGLSVRFYAELLKLLIYIMVFFRILRWLKFKIVIG